MSGTEQQHDITLYSTATPNGYAASIALEELDIRYVLKAVSFSSNEQKSEWYLKINPNGRIPAIVDHKNTEGDFRVFETSAILLYLAQHYDPEHKISFDPIKESNLYSEQIQWMMFAHGGIGPMQGQSDHFFRYAPEKIPYAIKRYQEETKRLYSVLETRLQGRDWLVGSHYSMADIKTLFEAPDSSRVKVALWAGVELSPYPNIQGWIDRINARPKTYAGLGIPTRSNLEEKLKNAEKIEEESRIKFGFKKV